MLQSLVGVYVYLSLCWLFTHSDASDSSDVKSVLNASEISIMLQRHNDFRRSVTPRASNMRALSWDKKLANLAQAYANKCIFRHSARVILDPYGYIAESIYIGNERSQMFSDDELARPVVSWCNESKFYDYNLNECQENKICGHYTQAVWDKTYHLGCGRARCGGNIPVGNKTYLNPVIVVCKYGPAGNTKRIFRKKPRRPYERGEWCSHCPDEAPVCNNKLCDIDRNSSVKAPLLTTTATTTPPIPAPNSTSTSTTTSATTKGIVKTIEPFLPVEFPLTATRKLITVNLFAVNRKEVENAGPIERSKFDVQKSEPTAGLMCHTCSGGSSVAECLSKRTTMSCEDEDLTIAVLGSSENDWSCAQYNKNNKVEMKCVPTAKCEQIKNGEDSNAKCCRTNYCNDAKLARISFTMLSLLNIFVFVVFSY